MSNNQNTNYYGPGVYPIIGSGTVNGKPYTGPGSTQTNYYGPTVVSSIGTGNTVHDQSYPKHTQTNVKSSSTSTFFGGKVTVANVGSGQVINNLNVGNGSTSMQNPALFTIPCTLTTGETYTDKSGFKITNNSTKKRKICISFGTKNLSSKYSFNTCNGTNKVTVDEIHVLNPNEFIKLESSTITNTSSSDKTFDLYEECDA